MLKLISFGFISARRFVAPLMLMSVWSFLASDLILQRTESLVALFGKTAVLMWMDISYVSLLFAAAQGDSVSDVSRPKRMIRWLASMLICASVITIPIGVSMLVRIPALSLLVLALTEIVWLLLFMAPAPSAVYGYQPHTAIVKSVKVMTEDLRRPAAMLIVLFLMLPINILVQSLVSWPGTQPQQSSLLFRTVAGTFFMLPATCIAGALVIQIPQKKILICNWATCRVISLWFRRLSVPGY